MDWKSFITLTACLIGIVAGDYTSEKDAESFLNESSHQLYRLYNEISDLTFHIDDKYFSDALEEPIFASRIFPLISDISKEAKKYKNDLFRKESVKKGILRLQSADIFVLENELTSTLSRSLNSLKNTATKTGICDYIDKGSCKLTYVPDVRKIFTNSLDPMELKHYWEQYRKQRLEMGSFHLNIVVELFRKAAQLNGVSVKEFWFRSYEDMNFFNEMEAVMHQLRPFYMEFHAYIRHELVVKYGNSVINEEDPIPDHLFEQVMHQAWKKSGVLSHSFPRQRLPNLKEGLESSGFDMYKILDHAEDFYKSLGFDPIPPLIRSRRFKEFTQNIAGKDCKADIFDLTPRVYMKYCKNANFKRFLQVHGYLGRVHYALEKKDLPYYFYPSFNLEFPFGEAVILAASTPEHMSRSEILHHFNYTNELSMNRLFRMGVHTIFNVAQHFVNTKVMLDILEARIPLERANQHYWSLMDEYVGVEPPMDRKGEDIDFPYNFFEDLLHNHQTRKFVSEILGYQMYESFCKMSGKFVAGDQSKPLNICDFYGSREVGTAVKNMMKMGSTKTWRDALSQIIQERPIMSASSLLEYYKPLQEWLAQKNRMSGTKLGWNKSSRDNSDAGWMFRT